MQDVYKQKVENFWNVLNLYIILKYIKYVHNIIIEILVCIFLKFKNKKVIILGWIQNHI